MTLADGRQLLVYNHTVTRPHAAERRRVRATERNGMPRWCWKIRPANTLTRRSFKRRMSLVHITYTWKRQRVKHVVVDPAKLTLRPIVDGQWPDMTAKQ